MRECEKCGQPLRKRGEKYECGNCFEAYLDIVCRDLGNRVDRERMAQWIRCPMPAPFQSEWTYQCLIGCAHE